jgi:FkbH-like protein
MGVKLKLIIWDLDDTLWSGTLAEGETVSLIVERAEILKRLNTHGIVSAICSKNDPDLARGRLQELGLWDQLVFCRISFAPKGEAVRSLIEDIQLRAENVLFVDDNPLNLAEVAHANPGIHTLDAATDECNVVLRQVVDDNRHVLKSRLDEYRSLEARLTQSRASEGDRESFLISCGIEACLIPRGDNIPYVKRIEELINRTNQLNYLKTRVEEGSIADYIGDVLHAELYSVAVWDRFGYHGIVGVAAVEGWKKLKHFAFSCRIMHMGIEQWVLARLKQRFTALDVGPIGLVPMSPSWVKEVPYSGEARERILQSESKVSSKPIDLRIMASCQSGSIAHYSGLLDRLEFDNAPRQFELVQVSRDEHLGQGYPKLLFYGAWTDYADPYWPRPFKMEDYARSARQFSSFVATKGSRMLVAIPPERLLDDKFAVADGVTRERVMELNAVWRGIASDVGGISVLDLEDLVGPSDIFDVRHYNVTLLKKVGEHLRDWVSVNTTGVVSSQVVDAQQREGDEGGSRSTSQPTRGD